MTEPVCTDTLVVETENGLHLVPCSQIARTANQFDAQVTLTNGEKKADARTILELMSLSASYGTQLIVEARGEGCEQVVAALRDLFAAGFPTETSGE